MRKKLLILFLALGLLGGIVPTLTANAEVTLNDWPISTGSEANTYFAPVSVPANLTAKYNPVVKGNTVLAVYNGRLYDVERSLSDKLYAIDLADNTVKWQFKPEGDPTPINELLAKDGLLLLTTGNKLYALEDTGSTPVIKWSREYGNQPIYDDSALYYIGLDKKVKAVDFKDGSTKWEYSLGQFDEVYGKMATGGGRLYFTVKNRSEMTYKMYSLDSATGQVLWTTDLYGHSQTGVPVYRDGKVYLDLNHSTYQNPKVYVMAYDAASGSLLWKYDLKGYFGLSPDGVLSINDNTVFTVNSEGYLIAIDKDTGAERWKVLFAEIYVNGGRQQDNSTHGPILVTLDKVYLANHNKIKVFDAVTGNLLKKVDLGANAPYRPAAIANGMLFVSDGPNLLAYAFVGTESDTTKPNAVGKTIKNANLRKGPGTQFEIAHVIPAGSSLTILSESGDWYEVEYRGTEATYSGYIAKFLVDTPVVGKTLKNANFRTGAGIQNNIIQVIPAGSQLTILAESGDWFQVQYNGSGTVKTGYIAKFLMDTNVTGITLKNANLRTGPGTEYGITRIIPVGSKLTVYSESSNWYRVEYRGSGTTNVGYIAKFLVDTQISSGTGQVN